MRKNEQIGIKSKKIDQYVASFVKIPSNKLHTLQPFTLSLKGHIGKVGPGPFRWDPFVGTLSAGPFRWDPFGETLSVGAFRWEPSGGNLSVGVFRWEP